MNDEQRFIHADIVARKRRRGAGMPAFVCSGV
jgi:hypothetical protein